MKRTQLFGYHSHAKLTEFAGYEMPLWYSTIAEEHMAVRERCGIFDVSHMGRFSVRGRDAAACLGSLVPTEVGSQPSAKSFYTLFLNTSAGIIDDLIIMKRSDSEFLVVVNAANAARDLALMEEGARVFDIEIDDITDNTAMVAVQGPRAAAVLQPLVATDLGGLKRFSSADTEVAGVESIVSRTGYTGEDGFEIIIHDVTTSDPAKAEAVWGALAKSASPCGLGARDSLRLEAGYPLHGLDIDEKTDPFETGLSWVISAGKTGYTGYDAVSKLRAAPRSRSRKGIVLDEGIPRHGFRVLDAQGDVVGQVTSGTFSPLIRKGIALALVKTDLADTSHAWVEVRGAGKAGRYVKPPFYDERLYGWKRGGNGK